MSTSPKEIKNFFSDSNMKRKLEDIGKVENYFANKTPMFDFGEDNGFDFRKIKTGVSNKDEAFTFKKDVDLTPSWLFVKAENKYMCHKVEGNKIYTFAFDRFGSSAQFIDLTEEDMENIKYFKNMNIKSDDYFEFKERNKVLIKDSVYGIKLNTF